MTGTALARVDRFARPGLWWLGAIVLIANLVHRIVLPPTPPDPATFPRTGDIFASRAEGFRQVVVAVRGDGLVLQTHVAPYAPGPPMHVHRGFAEVFRIESGTLQIDLPDRAILLGPGESFEVPPGMAHRPHNPHPAEVVIGSDEPVMPQAFAACLVQVYHFLDQEERQPGWKVWDLPLRVAALDATCDSSIAGVPTLAQAAAQWLIVPFARAAGYRNYYPELSLHPEPVTLTAGMAR